MFSNKEVRGKIVIFYRGFLIERSGGPSSYLFYLYQGFKKSFTFLPNGSFFIPTDKLIDCNSQKMEGIEVRFISLGFLKTLLQTDHINLLLNIIKKLLERINSSLILSSLSRLYFYFMEKRTLFNFLEYKNHIKNADILHFHFVLDLVLLKHLLRKSTIKILTVHTPESFTSELPQNKFWSKLLDDLKSFEKEAFEMADVYIYPSPNSLENHLNVFPFLERLVSTKKVYYCPTGVPKLTITTSREDVRKALNIPPEAFVLSYVGRHIYIKGFDILINAILNILKSGKEIYIITAGKGDLAETYKTNTLLLKYWRHIEWTDNPGNLINSSDCFVLPDRKCFFDLALLEAMSVGIPVIASRVGGNIYVASRSSGIILFDLNIRDLEKAILDISMLSKEEREFLGVENYKSYEEFFSIDAFVNNYAKTLREIYKDLKHFVK